MKLLLRRILFRSCCRGCRMVDLMTVSFCGKERNAVVIFRSEIDMVSGALH